ncbi:hypothetical protein HMPREF9075_01484 [Capnocytophaga sp. oral taxon 332 str. F0381]|uniref:hypothetical protein n=1 Tax=Capnocytophaga sp. oral taxon 332 TaxID=712213 RepID=UPI0002A425A5|nr:hypothetical protein [Capnocytophaga sp. oral taxon 332]EKY09106.1 hypothetical protein HMPREF9075_01484 [Capnocytophaga sp. oral taxon 332 str. F0381]
MENINQTEKDLELYLARFFDIYDIEKLIIYLSVTNKTDKYKGFSIPIFEISEALLGQKEFCLSNPIPPERINPSDKKDKNLLEFFYILDVNLKNELEKMKGKGVTLKARVKTFDEKEFISNEMNIDDLFKVEDNLQKR